MTRQSRAQVSLGLGIYGRTSFHRCVIRHSSSSIMHGPSSGHRPPPPPPTSVRQDTSICLRESYARVVAVDGRVHGGGGGAVAPPSPLGTARGAASLRSAPRIIVGLPLQQTQAGAKCQCQPNAQTRSTHFEGHRAYARGRAARPLRRYLRSSSSFTTAVSLAHTSGSSQLSGEKWHKR